MAGRQALVPAGWREHQGHTCQIMVGHVKPAQNVPPLRYQLKSRGKHDRGFPHNRRVPKWAYCAKKI